MAYVPGFRNDVFISYCHDDNISPFEDKRGWISDFGRGLQVWLKQHLGAPVAVWRDEKKLGGDHAFDDEIKSQIESSAVFLAVVTPLYLNSRYCTQEREWFLESVGKDLFVGSRMRGIRVVKTPQSDGSHRGVFSEGLGFDFFGAVEGDVDEFAPASREFDDRFGKVCKSIKGLLETLRRDRVSVYVAHCPSDLQSEREKLVTEFNDQGYRILPEIQIDSKNVDKVAKDGLEAARLSVHLLGVESDSLAVRQARIAMELEKPLVAWSSKPELYIGETKYGNFLRELMEYQDPLRQSQYLDRTRLERVKTEVLELLQPRAAAARVIPSDGRRVYILCDGNEIEDYKIAWKLKTWIVDRDGFKVDLPEIKPPDPAADHRRKLQSCDGLLLYWGQASDNWFEATKTDLRSGRFLSGAIGIGAEEKSGVAVSDAPIIPLYGNFQYDALDPFLQTASPVESDSLAMPAAVTVDVSCPFIGLQPFDEADAPWFFGRDEQVDELLRRLASTRFLAVIGTSGCGKSSLVRAGLVPSLKRGYLSDAGTRWKVAVMRPGSDPFGALTRALDDPSVLGPQEDRPQTLRRSSRGCVECVRPDLGENESLLLVVDQFEEIFRFRKETLIGSTDDQVAGTDDQADAFVKLLLASCEQDEVRIYVVLTMRSDYLGDCAVFRGLPEALNDAQYLVPVLTRRQLLGVIEEPVISAGGEMAPELVQRVLNDVGHELEQELDQLPVLEHALMRTWQESAGESSIQLEHYSRAGRMSGALNQHAKQLYSELSEPQQAIAKRVFQRLTEKETAGRDIRRPTSFGELREVTGASREELAHVIEHFRDFLYSSDKPPFTDRSMVDITHEALIRQWEDLRDWAAEESHSAEVYGRLAYDAGRNAREWEDPDLTEALRLRDTDGWNETWAKRYTPSELVYGQADKFLAESKRHRFRKKVGRIGLVVLVAALLAGAYFYQIRLEQVEARAQQALAQAARAEADKANLQLQAEAKAAEAEQLLAKAAQSSDAEAEELRRRANELAKQSESLKTNAEDYQTRVSELEGELKEARGTIEGLKGLVNAVGGEQAKEVLADVRGKLARAERESADLKKQLAALKRPVAVSSTQPGAVEVNPQDGLAYVWIPPGEFQMGCVPGDKQCDDDEEPRHPVKISKAFWLGRTEVTVEAYNRFAGGKGPKGQDDHPVVDVTGEEARRYCEWAGGRLPTEAEWEYAARAGKDGHKYPWGSNEPSHDTANYRGTGGRDTFNGTAPIGSFPANDWGLHDMAGNVWEWCSDWYDDDYYSDEPAKDPKGPSSTGGWVLRGGSWNNYRSLLRTSNRVRVVPGVGTLIFGFRCAREVSP